MTTLQFLRMRAKMKQAELAISLDTTQPKISLYETGRSIPPNDAAHLLATFRERLGDSLDLGPILGKLRPDDLGRSWEIVLGELFGRP